MKKIILVLVVLFAFSGCFGQRSEYASPMPPERPPKPAPFLETNDPFTTQDPITVSTMKITSPSFNHNENIPAKFTCDGENVNPALNISDLPDATQSLVLIADDPDSPSGTWIHWAVFNIDPTVTQIAENSVPAGGMEIVTTFGNAGYGGPCPGSGKHRYFFKLYALDTKLGLDQNATAKEIGEAMEGHILEYAELVGLYERPKN